MIVVAGPPEPSRRALLAEVEALRAYRAEVRRVRSEPGHVTKAELDAVEARYQERTRA